MGNIHPSSHLYRLLLNLFPWSCAFSLDWRCLEWAFPQPGEGLGGLESGVRRVWGFSAAPTPWPGDPEPQASSLQQQRWQYLSGRRLYLCMKNVSTGLPESQRPRSRSCYHDNEEMQMNPFYLPHNQIPSHLLGEKCHPSEYASSSEPCLFSTRILWFVTFSACKFKFFLCGSLFLVLDPQSFHKKDLAGCVQFPQFHSL